MPRRSRGRRLSDPRGGRQQVPRPDNARPGPPTPWTPLARVPLAHVVAAVRAHDPGCLTRAVDSCPEDSAERPSAVLCAVFEEEGQAHLVLTRRSSRLRSHTGEVSFPGGRIDPGESPTNAARREAHEEVGLPPEAVTPVGRLSTLTTSLNPAPITPIVATLRSRPTLQPNPAEVDRAFTVSVAELITPGVHHRELWAWPDGTERAIDLFELVDDTVWGATARMLSELLDWLADTPPPDRDRSGPSRR